MMQFCIKGDFNMTKKVPDKFNISGQTTSEHVMAGEPRNPGNCAEKLGIMESWKNKFGRYPKRVLVDRESGSRSRMETSGTGGHLPRSRL